MRRKWIAFAVGSLCLWTLLLSQPINQTENNAVSKYYLDNGVQDISSPNIVTSIYLYYRYYDTLFEALMLLFSVAGIMALTLHEGDDEDE